MTYTDRRTVNAVIFDRLAQLVGDLTDVPAYRRSEVSGLMPLTLDRLHETAGETRIALSHHYTLNGDMVPDPDMEIAILTESAAASALTYQDMFAYHTITDADGRCDKHTEDRLNRFLAYWLHNLIEQGHSLTTEAV